MLQRYTEDLQRWGKVDANALPNAGDTLEVCQCYLIPETYYTDFKFVLDLSTLILLWYHGPKSQRNRVKNSSTSFQTRFPGELA